MVLWTSKAILKDYVDVEINIMGKDREVDFFTLYIFHTSDQFWKANPNSTNLEDIKVTMMTQVHVKNNIVMN